jgi:hypothetical protein
LPPQQRENLREQWQKSAPRDHRDGRPGRSFNRPPQKE